MEKRRKKQSGFTLFEAIVALGIMSVLMAGFMEMFINSLRMSTRTTAELGASLDAENATRKIIDETREAWQVDLPGDSTDKFNTPTSETAIQSFMDAESFYFPAQGHSLSSFQTTDSGGNTIDTAICIVSPAVNSPIQFYTTSGNSTTLSSLYNRNLQGGFTIIYRADSDGTPDSAGGTYLFQATAPVTATTPATEIIPLCQHVPGSPDVAAGAGLASNAVQFVHPTDSAGDELTNEVETKIVSSYYSPINTQQGSETTNSTLDTSLTGKCVYLRDYNVQAPAAPTTFKSGYHYNATP